MKDRIIEPSEIIIEKEGNSRKENIAHANPWIRFIARMFDYSLFFLLLWSLRMLLHGHYPFMKYEYLIPFEFLAWIPFEAILLFTLGTTPGKWLLRTKLKQGRKEKLDFQTAMKRSFNVWFRGIGMGIPILNLFCLLNAYQKLKIRQVTSWDREEQITVTHYPISTFRLYFAVFVAILGFLLYYSNKG